ncbi:hypothetical protein HMPREF3192_01322 [Atopobium deltae]|uniref:Uncharacterized protein n=1 Tax=Atopobium deltae TaxID=1393034 RepID=A0A133XPV4_9ACTN|nr:hypothetical protein HMPREF3192_01322 [Atopobium deltae]
MGRFFYASRAYHAKNFYRLNVPVYKHLHWVHHQTRRGKLFVRCKKAQLT